MAQNIFQFPRFWLFLIRQVKLNLPSFLLGFGGLFGVLLLVSLATAYLNPEGMVSLVPFYLFSLFISGFIVTSRAFVELNNPKKSYHFLTLPVSTLEKLLAMWLLTSPIFVVVYMVIVDVVFQISLLKTGNMRLLGALFNLDNFESLVNYLVLQTIFFLGACTFRTNSFFKTVLSLLVFMLLVGIFTLAVLVAVFQGDFAANITFSTSLPRQLTTVNVVFIGFYFLLAPFMLLVSYFKLKERQV